VKRNELALLHAKLPIFQRHVAAAREIVHQALSHDKCPYIAFSGGKDSTVVLHLVREQQADVSGVWSDDEWYLPETEEYVSSISNVERIRTNAWHSEFLQIEGDYNGVPDYAQQQGYGLVFLGLRQEESVARRLHLRKLGALFYAKSEQTWHCNPIHNWTWQDVWAFILSRDVDYNKAYDKLEQLGVEPQYQRVGPLAVDRVLGMGQLAILKRGWPDLFNRFAAEFPEARASV